MDIDGLKQMVRDALDDAEQFALSTKVLKSTAADGISNDFLPGNNLRLSAASVAQPESADSITVRGTGLDLPFKGMPVELQFYLEGSAAAFSLTATGDTEWT